MNFEELYQELILDHSRRPRNFGELEGGVHVHGDNPSCGDEIHLHVIFSTDAAGTVTDIRFTGHGCAISQASASMMTAKLKGKSRAEAERLLGLFRERVAGEGEVAEPGPRELGDLNVLSGVRKFPQRVKCAMLSWRAFEQALSESPARVTTEDS